MKDRTRTGKKKLFFNLEETKMIQREENNAKQNNVYSKKDKKQILHLENKKSML